MKKIKKYLEERKIPCEYLKYYVIGGEYEIHHKCTGRPTYWLYKNHHPVTMRCSQRDFINVLEKIIKKEQEA